MTILYTFPYARHKIEIATLEKPLKQHLMGRYSQLNHPGGGDIFISKVKSSSHKIAPGKKLSVSGTIYGTNIAHIYAEVMLQDSERHTLFGPIYRQFIRAPKEEEIQGVVYPEWEEKNEIAYEFQAVIRLLSDGKNNAFAFFNPEQYGIGENFNLTGSYLKPEESKSYDASLTFDPEGKLIKTVIKSSGKRLTAPRAITPQHGDQFKPHVQLLASPKKDNGSWLEETGSSNKLTFGKKSFSWVEVPAFPGDYAVGFAVKDLDGRIWRRFKSISIHA